MSIWLISLMNEKNVIMYDPPFGLFVGHFRSSEYIYTRSDIEKHVHEKYTSLNPSFSISKLEFREYLFHAHVILIIVVNFL